MVDDQFMSAPIQVGLEVFDGIALSAEYHFNYFEPELFERHMIAKPDSVRRAQEFRQAEFLAGRLIARRALERLEAQSVEILIGQEGMPLWPLGLCGSISHTRKSVCCAVAKGNSRYVGIDCEDIVSRKHAAELAEFVLSPAEREKLRHSALGFAEGFTLLFSAKESFFKAVYPWVRRYIDFRAIDAIEIDDVGCKVSLACASIGHGRRVPILDVHYFANSDMIITLAHHVRNASEGL